jgi:hypothetical protein
MLLTFSQKQHKMRCWALLAAITTRNRDFRENLIVSYRYALIVRVCQLLLLKRCVTT